MRQRRRSSALQRLGYSQPEAAEVIGVGLSHIKDALARGELAEVEFPGCRRKVILHQDLEEYLRRYRRFRGTGHAGGTLGDTAAPPTPPSEDAPPDLPRRRGRPPKSAARSPPK